MYIHFSGLLILLLMVLQISAEEVELFTVDGFEYTYYLADICTGTLEFKVLSRQEAHLSLCTVPTQHEQTYEILLGAANNSKAIIRRHELEVKTIEIGYLLSHYAFNAFWVKWSNGTISVGRKHESSPFLEWTDPDPQPIHYVGVRSLMGSRANWKFGNVIGETINPFKARSRAVNWKPATNGKIPPNSYVGGTEYGRNVYVARSYLGDDLVPGRVVSGHNSAIFASEMNEVKRTNYEVLVKMGARFVSFREMLKIDPYFTTAIPCGEGRDGEVMYIAQVEVGGGRTIGRVQFSISKNALIPYGDRVMEYRNYDILAFPVKI